MPPFVRLLDADRYLPGLWDLRVDPGARAEWSERLQKNVADIAAMVATTGTPDEATGAATARREWTSILRRLDEPAVHDRFPTVLDLVKERDRLLRHHGVRDAFGPDKAAENARCIEGYPSLVAEHDAIDDPWRRIEACVWAVLVGNVFDMAAPRVAEAVRAGGDAMTRLAAEVRERPLAVDGRARFRQGLDRLRESADLEVLLLVDNAGMDFVLGVVPLARALAREGFRVTLGANEWPSLNDVTAEEAPVLLGQLAEVDPTLSRLLDRNRITVISTGNDAPGIDFRDVPDALNEIASRAGLLIIDGQGRAVETSWRARMDLPTLRLCTLKSPIVAAHLGMTPFEPIVDYREVGEGPPRG